MIQSGNIRDVSAVRWGTEDRPRFIVVRPWFDAGPLKDWIIFFEHWQESALMASITHLPVQRAMAQLQALSANDEH